MTPTMTRIGTLQTDLGESPVWDAAAGRLWVMDCRRGSIHSLHPETGKGPAWTVPAPAGSFALTADGHVVVALKTSVALLDTDTGELRTLGEIHDSHPNLRLNDGKVLPDGSFLVGTMHVHREADEPLLGGVYRLAPDGGFARVAPALGVTNGPCVSPLDGRLYVADSAARRIDSYALAADGTLTDARVFVRTANLDSAPDGAAFDTDGGLWVALVHAGAIVRFDAQGQVTQRVDVPLTHPASLCFGGPDLTDLFVTSIRDSGRLLADGPLDGAVLRVRGLDVAGAPVPVCRLEP